MPERERLRRRHDRARDPHVSMPRLGEEDLEEMEAREWSVQDHRERRRGDRRRGGDDEHRLPTPPVAGSEDRRAGAKGGEGFDLLRPNSDTAEAHRPPREPESSSRYRLDGER